MRRAFEGTLLGRHRALYVRCDRCELLQVVEPAWLEEAYSSAISSVDTGLVARNLIVAQRVSGLLAAWFGMDATCVDLAGGYGLLVRLLRDRGIDAFWDDPYAVNELARGFEFQAGQRVDAVTAIEVLEHVQRPRQFLEESFDRTGSSAVIFTTELYQGQSPPADWWYYQPETGQHISFYTRKTLRTIARSLGCTLYSRGSFHALATERLNRLPFAMSASRLRTGLDLWATRGRTSRTQADSDYMAALARAARQQ